MATGAEAGYDELSGSGSGSELESESSPLPLGCILGKSKSKTGRDVLRGGWC